MLEIKCDRCRKLIEPTEFSDAEFIQSKAGNLIMCDECENGWIEEKNKLEKKYKDDVEKERDKYIKKLKDK